MIEAAVPLSRYRREFFLNESRERNMMDIITSGLAGIGVGNVIIFIISVVLHEFIPVDPEFVKSFDDPLVAIGIQMLMMWLTGNFWLFVNRIYRKDWPLKKRTLVHFVLSLLGMLAICWPLWWIPHDLVGVLESIGIYVLVYSIVWFFSWRKTGEKA